MNAPAFFAAARTAPFGGRMTQAQVDGCSAVLREAQKRGWSDPRWTAYALATAHHETGGRMEPLEEDMNYSAERMTQVWPSRFPTVAAAQPFARNPEALAERVYGGRIGNDRPGDGWRYRGRGLVQITGRGNYRTIGGVLGLALEDAPEIALEPDVSAAILCVGMEKALFTGRPLRSFFDSETDDPVGARRIVNADVARVGAKIAATHRAFLAALQAAERQAPKLPAPPPPETSSDALAAEVEALRRRIEQLEAFRAGVVAAGQMGAGAV